MKSHKFSERRSAFTLVEMLLVIALIAILAGVAIVNVDKIFGQNQESVASIFVSQSMKAPLTSYRINMGSYPSTAEGIKALLTAPSSKAGRWKGPYLDVTGNNVPEDPWGNPYQYRYPGTRNTGGYDLYSWGSDGVESEDDVGNW